MSEPLLSIRNLTKLFGGLVAVDNVSLDVRRGEVVGLLGDNGAGKSTLIKCVSGVYQAEEGEIVFDGKPVAFASPMDARRVGIETIYQDLALANNLDVGANIFLGREVKKRFFGGLVQTLDDRMMLKESRQTLDSLQIRFPTLTEPIENLSGGQRQAVAIARAVYWDAKLMIMDEPTNNLGVPEQQKVLELIRTLKARGVPVILITHILPDVFAVTDRVIVMHRGRKVAEKITARRLRRSSCSTWSARGRTRRPDGEIQLVADARDAVIIGAGRPASPRAPASRRGASTSSSWKNRTRSRRSGGATTTGCISTPIAVTPPCPACRCRRPTAAIRRARRWSNISKATQPNST